MLLFIRKIFLFLYNIYGSVSYFFVICGLKAQNKLFIFNFFYSSVNNLKLILRRLTILNMIKFLREEWKLKEVW